MRPNSLHRRLGWLILIDAVTAWLAAVLMLLAWLLIIDSRTLPALTALVALSGVAMATALVPLHRGNTARAVAVWAGANWCIALISAAGASFAWPVMALTAVLPAVLATAFATGRELTTYVLISLSVCTAAVFLGVLTDVTGLTAATPDAIQHGLLVIFTPTMAAMIGLIVLNNSLRLQAALAATVRSRARVVAAGDRERRRIERDLHDGAQQRLISIGIELASARKLCHRDPDAAVSQLDELRHQLHAAHREVRDLAQGVYPPVLAEHGLVEALRSAVDRYPLPLTLELRDPGRLAPDLETAIYFGCKEALQNAAKHSQAGRVRLVLSADDRSVWFEVHDDGVGFVPPSEDQQGGLVSMEDRLGASGGAVEIVSAPGDGTVVVGRVNTG